MSRNMPTIIDKTGPEMLIDYYKAIEDSSAKMLQAAQSKDWDGVVRYEGHLRGADRAVALQGARA